jgi:23S rRNA (adenine2503-C2)-methyltransferase
VTSSLKSLAGLDLPELERFVRDIGEPAYRARQLTRWLYRSPAESFSEMTNLPSGLRDKLCRIACLRVLEPAGSLLSADGTRKLAFRLENGAAIETVVIPAGKRSSVCVSTQAGCAFSCIFCASGARSRRRPGQHLRRGGQQATERAASATASLKNRDSRGLVRDLTAGEIVEQVVRARFAAASPVSNVVLMGMGEPLANYANTLKAVRLICDPALIGIGQRRIAVSTCGLVPQIRKLAQEKLQIHLAVSLHAPDDEVRQKLMPVPGRYPLASLLEACREYFEKTGRKVMFEYILIEGINDAPSMAKSLVRLVRGFPCVVNLIAMNPVEFRADLRPPEPEKVEEFASILRRGGVEVAVRQPHGRDIAAACGQLAGRISESMQQRIARQAVPR